MPRARCPESIEAERRYKAGEKLVDIARSLQVPDSTVRRWKSSQDWDGKKSSTGKKKQSERSETKANVRKHETRTGRPLPTVDQQLAAAVEENEELTAQQKDFCLFFSRIKNATQAYLKAYGCSYNAAKTHGWELLQNVTIKAELRRLRDIKAAALGEICGDDVIEMHMRIAFADITDFMEFKGKTAPVMHKGEVVMMMHPKTHESIPVTETVNTVKLKDSTHVDGQLINEVSQSKDGVKIKLADRQKSLDFLARHFELNPMDRHKKEYDDKRQELERAKYELAKETQSKETKGNDIASDWIAALMGGDDENE